VRLKKEEGKRFQELVGGRKVGNEAGRRKLLVEGEPRDEGRHENSEKGGYKKGKGETRA